MKRADREVSREKGKDDKEGTRESRKEETEIGRGDGKDGQ